MRKPLPYPNKIPDEIMDGSPSYQKLTIGNIYRVIEISIENVRLMNDVGFPGLYPLSWFSVMDNYWPDDWVVTIGEEGERYVGPKALSDQYFWERYFDGDREAIKALNNRLIEWGYSKE